MRSNAFPSGEGGPWNTVDEESRDVKVGVAAQNTTFSTSSFLPFYLALFKPHMPEYIEAHASEILLYLFVCISKDGKA